MPRSISHFPYVRYQGAWYPVIPVHMSFGAKRLFTLALVDSGASVSFFRPEIAEALGVAFKGRRTSRLGTAKGAVDIAMSRVMLTVAGRRFQTTIGFSAEPSAPFNIIGRDGFFTEFQVTFDDKARRLSLRPHR